MVNFSELVGKKVVAFRGMPFKKSHESRYRTDLSYMLFDDGETYVTFSEQDPYDYRDCCDSARIISVEKDKDLWRRMMNCEGYQEPDYLGSSPF